MSLEQRIQELTAVVATLTQVMSQQQVNQVAAPVAAPVADSSVPFNSPETLVQYVMTQYQAMSVTAQGLFPQLLTHFGIAQVSELKPENYEVFYQSVEALKSK